MTLVRDYYDSPKDVFCKTLIIQGKNDNLVPLTSTKYVYDTIGSKDKKLVYIDNVTHDIFRAENKEEIFKLVQDFLKRG